MGTLHLYSNVLRSTKSSFQQRHIAIRPDFEDVRVAYKTLRIFQPSWRLQD